MKDRRSFEVIESRQMDHLRVFHDVARALTSSLELEEILGAIMDKMAQFFGPERWSMLMVDDKSGELYYAIDVGENAESLKGLRVPLGEGVAGWVASTGNPLVVPDVALDAYPGTNATPAGYMIYCTVAKAGCPPSGYPGWFPVGGTSAVAPLWAALISRLAEASGQRFGLIQTLLYAGVTPGAAVPGFRDITSGNNGAYAAGPGWDACSGLGSPDGTALLSRLQD